MNERELNIQEKAPRCGRCGRVGELDEAFGHYFCRSCDCWILCYREYKLLAENASNYLPQKPSLGVGWYEN